MTKYQRNYQSKLVKNNHKYNEMKKILDDMNIDLTQFIKSNKEAELSVVIYQITKLKNLVKEVEA